MAKHGFLNLEVEGQGDTEIDFHHTVEDAGSSTTSIRFPVKAAGSTLTWPSNFSAPW
jgi:hypothetical protein